MVNLLILAVEMCFEKNKVTFRSVVGFTRKICTRNFVGVTQVAESLLHIFMQKSGNEWKRDRALQPEEDKMI